MRRRLLSVLLALALVAVVPAAPGFAGESEQPSFDENAVVAAPTQSALADESVESKPALVQEDTLQGEPEPGVTDETEPALSTEPQEAETDSTGDRKTPDTQEGEGIIPFASDFARLFESQATQTAAEIVLQAQKTGTLTLNNRWNSDVAVSQSSSGSPTTVSKGQKITLTVAQRETITVKESNAGATFRSWYSDNSTPFVSGVQCALVTLPKMSAFTIDTAGTVAGDYFFAYFNLGGSLTSLPEGSFDISNINAVVDYFFYCFNSKGHLTSLPEGSFDTSNINAVGDNFFSYFNSEGHLISLPEGSFDTSNINAVGNYFFAYFNWVGSLTSLPKSSFETSGIVTVGGAFFANFNWDGILTSLPEGSFDTSNINTVGDNFFASFNYEGALTSLPEGSFDTSGIVTVGNGFFANFNWVGSLTSLPEGSFDISNIKTAGNNFFADFNANSSLTSLPAGSFDTSGIKTVGNGFFYCFNSEGHLTSLPEGSFDTYGIKIVGDNFFTSFNYEGALTSLPLSFRLPQEPNSVGVSYCTRMFSESALVRGDEKVPLYFAAGSMSAFSGTDITPESPNAKQTVWVNASTKDITSFAFRIHSVVHHGTINGTDITFASLPSGTDVTALTPAIVHDGASVSPSGPQNFSKPVVYTVKAVDGSEKSYTVTVLVEVKVIPVITEFVPWKGSGPATARIDADLEKFVRLTLNGQVVDPAHYTLASGSTIITLSEAYLKTLSNGTHVFTAEFTDGTATLPLVVDLSTPGTDSNTLPKTGDSGASLVLLAVLALATAGGGLLLLARRRLWSGELRDKEGSALSH